MFQPIFTERNKGGFSNCMILKGQAQEVKSEVEIKREEIEGCEGCEGDWKEGKYNNKVYNGKN